MVTAPASSGGKIASIDFAGHYSFTNFGKIGHNRNFDDPIEEAKWAVSETLTTAEDQRQRSDKEEATRAASAATKKV